MAEEILYKITVEGLQEEAQEKLGRELTEEELQQAKKKIETGINSSIDIIFAAVFEEMRDG